MKVEETPATIEDVRERLRSQGYLDAGMERAIFTAPRASGAIVPSVIAGAVALATASSAAVASRGAATPAAGVLVLFAVLFAFDLALAAGAGAALYGLSRVLRAPEHPKRPAVAAAAVAAGLTFLFYWAGIRRLPAASRAHPVLALIPVCITAFYFARAVRATALSLTLRRHVPLPDRPGFRRGSAAALVLLLAAFSISGWRGSPPARFPDIAVSVSPSRKPLVVVGLDGVAPQTLALLGQGEPSVSWRRAAGPPPEVWSTIATGVSPGRHGVAAFERASLFGAFAVRPPYFTAWMFRGPLRWIGAAGRLPVSGAERRAYAFWEVASRVGVSTAVVNWWASERVPGAEVVENAEVAARAHSGAEDDELAAASFRDIRQANHPALAVVYLPGADIDGGGVSASARRLIEEEIERERAGEESLWLVADSGRSGDAAGAVFFDTDALNHPAPGTKAEDIAPTILARLGIPAASDLDGAPLAADFRPDALERRRVATYGPRSSREPVALNSPSGREYLEKLKSLGYLK